MHAPYSFSPREPRATAGCLELLVYAAAFAVIAVVTAILALAALVFLLPGGRS